MAGDGAGAWWTERMVVGQTWWRALRQRGRDGARARWCGRDGGAVNGEEQTTRANMVETSGYTSAELGHWTGVVWPINRGVQIDGRP